MTTTKTVAALAAATAMTSLSLPGAYIGGSVGYLVDGEDTYTALRVGFTVAQQDSFAHQLELEIGYTEQSELGVDGEILPLMANYRFAIEPDSHWVYTVGAGVGMARTEISYLGQSDSDWVWGVQTFASAGYRFTPAFDLSIGARYLYFGDVDLFGISAELEDDISLELGATFRF